MKSDESDESVETVERASRRRAIDMVISVPLLWILLALQFGDPDDLRAGPGLFLWLSAVGGLTACVALGRGGGALKLPSRARRMLDDELSLRNRARSLAAGFYATLAAGLAIFVATWSIEIVAGDAIKLITAAGLSTALAVYARLEW